VSAAPERVKVYLDPAENRLFLSVYEDGEIIAQPDMDWERAVELASDILMTALAVKRKQGGGDPAL
jgi:hypothetical protein